MNTAMIDPIFADDALVATIAVQIIRRDNWAMNDLISCSSKRGTIHTAAIY